MNFINGAIPKLGNSMQSLSGLSGNLSAQLNIGINTNDSMNLSNIFNDGTNSASSSGIANNFMSGLGTIGLNGGMGMLPGFGGSCNQTNSMFGGMMQGMQQQQQMMMMMMTMMMMMMMQQQNQLMNSAMQSMMGGSNGTQGINGGSSNSGGTSGVNGASSASSPQAAGTNQEAIAKLQQLGMKASSIEKVKKLDGNMQIKVAQLYEYGKSQGIDFTITSGLRTREEQQKLYNQYGPSRAAKPGTSRHESGMAIDIGGCSEEQKSVLGKYWKSIGGVWGGDWGSGTTIREPWHFDLRK